MQLNKTSMLAAAVSVIAIGVTAQLLTGDAGSSIPWSKSESLAPAVLAKQLTSGKTPNIFCVAFPMLYRQKHILHAKYAGPGGRPEGLKMLQEAVSALPKSSEIILYCGCCPLDKCPNIRPAYKVLKDLGYTNIRVLDTPTNMHDDWYSKGYPSE